MTEELREREEEKERVGKVGERERKRGREGESEKSGIEGEKERKL